MKRFVNSFVIVAVVLSILLPLVTPPVMAAITNMGVKQLTTGPWDQRSWSWDTYAISWSPDGTKIAYISIENTFQEGKTEGPVNNTLVLGVMDADGTGKIKCDEFSAIGDRDHGFLCGFDFDWSPDSKTIVYAKYGEPLESYWEDDCDSASIWGMNIETTEKKELAQRAMYPSLSPDGAKIVYIFKETPDANHDVWMMDADGGDKRKLALNHEYDALLPSWSPDGTKIAYMAMVRQQWETVSIWITGADGANNSQLVSGGGFPKWSPDGTKIAYQSMDEKGGKPEQRRTSVWIVNPDGTGEKCLLTDSSVMNFEFSIWSPDSTKLTSLSSTVEGMVILNADGSGKYWTLPNNGFYSSWSPDGKMITYTSIGTGDIKIKGDINIINADGTQDKKLMSGEDIQVAPFGGLLWNPDGTQITYTAREAEGESGWGATDTCSVWVMAVGETPSGTPTSVQTIIPTHEGESPSSEKKGIPGFEVVSAIAGLLVVAYLLRGKD